ncbi:butyrophilin-like protein 1 [Suncus etruscus]|uniref:butyrophilin-like protein 1 n=1 Tax=Suncus etruscus TaxID=109475 RepID=UPI00210FA9C1|nr:butyrophilin-like protein 1 [Suncus etruscus]
MQRTVNKPRKLALVKVQVQEQRLNLFAAPPYQAQGDGASLPLLCALPSGPHASPAAHCGVISFLAFHSHVCVMSVSAFTEEFLVIAPPDPIIATLGSDITLPCRVSPAMNVENMELRWFRSKFSEAVFIYQNQWEETEEQMAQYRGRTSLVKDLLFQGEAAVLINKVQTADNGLYTCFFRKGGFYEEAVLELKVAGVGSAPQVHITGPEDDGVRVVCSASGWFPKPQVQWRDSSGEKFLAFSETQTQDAEGLFSVEAALVVRDSAVRNVTCSILNPILGQEKAVDIYIPEPFFPKVSPWKMAFVVFVTILIFLALGVAYFIKREHAFKVKKKQERESLCQAKEEDEQTMQESLKAIDELQAHLDQRKTDYFAAWRKAHLYADWRKVLFQTCSVTLDPRSASPDIVLSHENKSLTLKDTSAYSDLRYNVLGHEVITSGRCCWEVEIKNGDKSTWALGVCMEDVKRTGFYTESPQKGFWVIGNTEDGYIAFAEQIQVLSPRQVIQRLGVFLDYEEGDVSFYDMTDGSHIFSFPQASFSGTLFPYFMIKSGKVFLTICSMEGGSEHPVPHSSDPSWEEPVNPLGEGFSPDSVVAEAPSGPESPLLSHNSDNMLPSSREEPVSPQGEGFSPDSGVAEAPSGPESPLLSHNSDNMLPSSREEPVSPQGEDFSPDSGVAEAPSGPESPLLPHNSDNMLPSSREEPVRILEEGFSPDTSVDNAP